MAKVPEADASTATVCDMDVPFGKSTCASAWRKCYPSRIQQARARLHKRFAGRQVGKEVLYFGVQQSVGSRTLRSAMLRKKSSTRASVLPSPNWERPPPGVDGAC